MKTLGNNVVKAVAYEYIGRVSNLFHNDVLCEFEVWGEVDCLITEVYFFNVDFVIKNSMLN